MATELTQLFHEALELTDNDRAMLAGLLIESLEGPKILTLRARGLPKLNAAGKRLNPARSRPSPGMKSKHIFDSEVIS